MALSWTPPSDWKIIRTIEAHTCGEPLRIVVEGVPPIPGRTILEKRSYAREYLDGLRRSLMWEPRGHADMYGAILTDSVTPDGDFGVLFCHNKGFSTMCGHGVIALTTALINTGIIKRNGERTILKLDTPAGRVTAVARCGNGTVEEVSFINVPSFVFAKDKHIEIPGLGTVRYDIAFGGAFYAFVDAAPLDLELEEENFRLLIDTGMQIKRAVMAELPIRHPLEEDLGFLYGTIFIGPAKDPSRHSRNVCIFAEGEVDRSPTGTGVSARAAIHFSRKEIGLNEPFTVESILGTTMTVRVVKTAPLGAHTAVIPEVTGKASLTGCSEIWIDPKDPLREGFLLR